MIEYIQDASTYKLRAPGITDHAIYFTIVGNPITALFVNSKEMNSFQWIVALMTSYTRRLKIANDYKMELKNIIHDMCETFDPKGGYIVPDGTNQEVHSVVHHLGLTLQKHITDIPD